MRIPSLAVLFALPRTSAAAGFAVLLLAGCQRDATVVRMQDLPTLAATHSTAGAPPSHLGEELNPRLLRRFAADDMVFKVPSLRNVARTAPYFHDGSTDSLDTAVRMMAHHPLGVDLSVDEARSIAAWLGSLTGEIPQRYIAAPTMPVAARL